MDILVTYAIIKLPVLSCDGMSDHDGWKENFHYWARKVS